jgi:hypothetical protein
MKREAVWKARDLLWFAHSGVSAIGLLTPDFGHPEQDWERPILVLSF